MANKTTHINASKPADSFNRTEIALLDKDAGIVPLGAIVGRNSDEFYQNADDTRTLTELGLNIDPTQEALVSQGDGDLTIRVNRGLLVPFKIATLTSDANARTKYGQPVYALFNDEVSLLQGTFGNLVGRIAFHNSITEVVVEIAMNVHKSGAREIADLEYGETLLYRVDAAAVATTVIVDDLPFKVRLIDAWSVATTADGGTWKITDGTSDIVPAVTAAAVDKDIDRALQIDDSKHEVAAGGNLEVVTTGASFAPIVYVKIIRVP